MFWHKLLPQRLGAVILAAGLLVGLHFGGDASPAAVLERFTYDRLLKYLPQQLQEHRIVLVDIDEKALSEVGPWPWPRETVARLIDRLTTDYQVAILGVDMVFPNGKLGDEHLRQALAHPAVVMGQALSRHSEVRTGQPADLIVMAPYPVSVQVQGFVANEPSVLPAHPQIGHISPLFDADGLCRRVQPILCLQEGCSLSLAFRIYQHLMQASAPRWVDQPISGLFLPAQVNDDLLIPLDKELAALTPYRVPSGGFQLVSASDVLAQRIPADQLHNLIVLMGSTALGLGDRVATPRDTLTPGLEIHAQWLSALLDRQFITPVGEQRSARWGLMAILMLLFLRWPWQGPRGLFAWTLGLGSASLLAAYGLWVGWGVWGPLAPGLMTIVMLGVTGLIFESLALRQKMQTLALQMSPLIPKVLITRLLSGQGASAGTEHRTITVLVADMRGFTIAAERASPEQVAALAQRCLETMATVVRDHGGEVEKYTGDGLMALWGATEPDDAHARHAIEAAMAMRAAVDALNPWMREQGFPPARVSIGINTGEGAVGLYGSASRLAWSAHGDAVNVATRIEQLTREVGCDLLFGQQTAEHYGLTATTYLGEYAVKGRQQKVAVYTLETLAV